MLHILTVGVGLSYWNLIGRNDEVTKINLFRPLKRKIRDYLTARWDLTQRPRCGSHSYAQEGEDILLCRILDAYGESTGTYVEVGSNSPWRCSNTAFWYLKGWRGVAIDPNPDFAAEFARERPGDVFLNLGVADAPGCLTYYRFPESLYNTFSLVKAQQLVNDGIMPQPAEVTVQVETLGKALERVWPDGKQIDLLSIDAEGFDEKIIRGHNFGKYPARFIVVELEHHSVTRALYEPVAIQLMENGYICVSKLWKSGFFLHSSIAAEYGV